MKRQNSKSKMNKSVTLQAIDLNNNKDKQHTKSPKQSVTSDNIAKLNTNGIDTANDSAKLKPSESFSRHLCNLQQGRFDDPCHCVRPSLLNSNSGYTNYRGLLNLCIILLIMSTSRLVLENIIKYGFLVRFDVPLLFLRDPTAWPSLLAMVCTNIFILTVFFIEKKISTNSINESVGVSLGILTSILALTLPPIYLWLKVTNPLSSFMALFMYAIISLKLFSYIHVNKTCRKYLNSDVIVVKQQDNENRVQYPDNLNLKDMYYFIWAPTLCYELNFPRSERVHIRFLIRRLAEIAFLLTIQSMFIQQWIVPILKNSKIPFNESSRTKIMERLLKLAVPNHVVWFIFFYAFFHSWLNVLAELLRFGDREFYRDWWNAENVDEFWQNWNIPVHKFCVRHIYKPLLRKGFNRVHSTIIVFIVSAFFHEYLVSVPLRMFRLWSFAGMIGQVPFAYVVKRYLDGHYGNMALWVSLIIGQPLAIMMYIHDYYISYYQSTV